MAAAKIDPCRQAGGVTMGADGGTYGGGACVATFRAKRISRQAKNVMARGLAGRQGRLPDMGPSAREGGQRQSPWLHINMTLTKSCAMEVKVAGACTGDMSGGSPLFMQPFGRQGGHHLWWMYQGSDQLLSKFGNNWPAATTAAPQLYPCSISIYTALLYCISLQLPAMWELGGQ